MRTHRFRWHRLFRRDDSEYPSAHRLGDDGYTLCLRHLVRHAEEMRPEDWERLPMCRTCMAQRPVES